MSCVILQRFSSAATKNQSFSAIKLKDPRCKASNVRSPWILPYFSSNDSASLIMTCPNGYTLKKDISSLNPVTASFNCLSFISLFLNFLNKELVNSIRTSSEIQILFFGLINVVTAWVPSYS